MVLYREPVGGFLITTEGSVFLVLEPTVRPRAYGATESTTLTTTARGFLVATEGSM